MATNGKLNDMEQFRSVVVYESRKRNPASTWSNRETVPDYLDEWAQATATRGPYQTAENARRQAGRDASEHSRGWGYQLGKPIQVTRVLSVGIERTSLAWEPFDERDEKGWGSK